MSSLRNGFVVVVCLALGLGAGWQLHRLTPAKDEIAVVDGKKTRAIRTEPPAKPISVVAASTSKIIGFNAVTSPSVTERLATLRWLKSNGLYVAIPVFSDDHLSSQFSTVYGLTTAEIEQIDQAFKQAKQHIDELTNKYAQLDPSSTTDKMIVTVPPFPAEGGQVYNSLVTAFSSVLGDERYTLFNSISGELLERSLGSFGIENNRYEVTISTVKAEKEVPVYTIKRSYTVAGIQRGSSGSVLDAAGVTKFFPLLSHFPLPTAPTPTEK